MAVVLRTPRMALPQPPGDQPGPQDMLHRLAHPQVGRQRERGHELGQPQPRVLITCLHAGHATRTRPAEAMMRGESGTTAAARSGRGYRSADAAETGAGREELPRDMYARSGPGWRMLPGRVRSQ